MTLNDLCSLQTGSSWESVGWVYIFFSNPNPNWIYHNPQESQAIHIDATIAIIDEALSAGKRVFYASTAYVFDGEKEGYIETDFKNPSTLYGQQKVEIENYLINNISDHVIGRLGYNVSSKPLGICPIKRYVLLSFGRQCENGSGFKFFYNERCRYLSSHLPSCKKRI